MHHKATNKLLHELTGKELYQLVTAVYLEHLQSLPPTFSDSDLDQAIAALSKRPNEKRDFCRWGEASSVIHIIEYELRLRAMDAVWRLTALSEQLGNHVRRFIIRKEEGEDQLTQIDEFHGCIQIIQEVITYMTKHQAKLDAFSEVLGVDLSVMARYEMGLLAEYIEVYNSRAEFFNNYSLGEDIHYLPILSIFPAPTAPERKKQLIQDIERAKDTSFWNLLKS